MELGVHLPLIPFDEPLSLKRLEATADAARECGFAAVSVNDHFVFQRPWLDGPTALVSVISRSGTMEYAEAGCERVYLWPPGGEARQLELFSAAANSA